MTKSLWPFTQFIWWMLNCDKWLWTLRPIQLTWTVTSPSSLLSSTPTSRESETSWHQQSMERILEVIRQPGFVLPRQQTKPPDLDCDLTLWAAIIYTHHCHQLLLSLKADAHFTIPQRREGWVDLGTVVRVCNTRLYITVVFVTNTQTDCSGIWSWDHIQCSQSCYINRPPTPRPSSPSSSSSSLLAAAAAADLTHLVFMKLSISLPVHVLHLKHSYQHKQNSHHLTSPNIYSNRVSKILSTK